MMKKQNMKFNKIIAFILFLLCTFYLHSQENVLTVKGYIHDNEGAVENAYIEFVRDSTRVICVSRANGRFESLPLKKGEYQINISHISHISIHEKMNIREMLDFKMEINNHLLDEITIQGDIKKALRTKNGSLVLDPSFLSNTKVSSVYQLLSKIPGVDVSSSGVSLNGQSAGFKIDGRETGLSSSSLSAYLKSIPADKIKEIVLASSAAAENKASDTGGQINVVLKKEADNSQSLNLKGSMMTVSDELKGSLGGFYSVQKDNTHLSLFLEYENDYDKYKSNAHTIYSDIGTSDGHKQKSSRGNDYFGVLNLDHTFRNNNILHLNASLYYEDYNRRGDLKQDYYRSGTLTEKIHDELRDDDMGDLYRVYLDYKTNDTLKWKHEIGYGVVWGKSDKLAATHTGSDMADNFAWSEIAIKNRHHGTQHQIHYDLVYSAANLDLKMGVRADLGKLHPSSRYDSIIGGQPVFNPQFSSEYNLKENIYAAYASLQYKINNISLYAGVRAEITDMSVYSLYDKVNWDYNRTHLFPYAKISGALGALNTTLSFSSGISRPPYLYYTPNYRYASKYSYDIGNPNLLPTRFYSVRWENLLFDFFSLNLSYSKLENVYGSLTYNGENDFEQITSYLNYANEHRFVANIYLPYQFCKEKISGSLGFYGRYSRLADCDKRMNFHDKNTRGYVISNSTDFNLTDKLTIGYSIRYQSRFYYPQSRVEDSGSFDLNASYTWKKLTLGIQAYDLFNTDIAKGKWYYVQNTTDGRIQSYTQRFGVSIRYTIMKGKKIKERSDKGADSSRFGN